MDAGQSQLILILFQFLYVFSGTFVQKLGRIGKAEYTQQNTRILVHV